MSTKPAQSFEDIVAQLNEKQSSVFALCGEFTSNIEALQNVQCHVGSTMGQKNESVHVTLVKTEGQTLVLLQ